MVNYQELLDYYESFEILCAIWCHLYNFRNVKNTNGRVLLLVKLQAKASNFTESNTPLCVFFTFLKLCKWHQIEQSNTFIDTNYTKPTIY